MLKPLLLAIGAIAAVTAVLRASGADTTIAALIYILVILVVASRAPLAATAITCALAIVPFHFYFVPVLGSFVITDPLHWVVLATFLAVGLVAGQLSSSARRRAERDHAAQLALQRAELSSALLASLSHNLRTPLAATRVAISNINDPHLSESERTRQATVAMEQIVRLDRAFHDILDLARIQTHSLVLERQWVTPAEIVDAATARAGAVRMSHRLVVDVDESIEAEIDPRLTTAALAHLIENAAQYAPRGSHITLAGRADGGAVRFSVSDEGPGFDSTDAERMFEPFYRGQHATAIRAGTGLGLTIATGLLGAEGGRLAAERLNPRGARFSIVLPAALRRSDSEPAA